MNFEPASPSISQRCALALMAKVPVAGAVKTRLTPPLTPEEAATLSICFLRDMTTNLCCLNGDSVEAMVLYTPAHAKALLQSLLPSGIGLVPQRGETLGERLGNAAAELLEKKFDSVCLINSDSPTLPRKILRSAISLLEKDGDRIVLGPSQDGGYYLIGLKQAHRSLFEGIAWSTGDVLAQTMARAAEMDLTVELLTEWYDVDDAATLRQLGEELSLLRDSGDGGPHFHAGFEAPHTRAYLAGLIAENGPERILGEASTVKRKS